MVKPSAQNTITGAELVALFISKFCSKQVFLVTGGACAFIVDAIGRNREIEFVCFQHEQAAAMAADAVWRTTGRVGVTVATSGPGATNLITGIACSWFDSIPSIHITGQVNQIESREFLGANVRQAGFQETDIVSMVKPITKLALKIESVEQLVDSLPEVLHAATTGRMGPVLLDIPINIQKAEITDLLTLKALSPIESKLTFKSNSQDSIVDFFKGSLRPLAIIGAGAGLSGTAQTIADWCVANQIPFASSWGALTYLERSEPLYQGSIGVYGSRHANWCVQGADRIIVFGSRLDNRQRTGNPKGFAPFAKILVLDIDQEELNKYTSQNNYAGMLVDLRETNNLLPNKSLELESREWVRLLLDRKSIMSEGFDSSVGTHELNPYFAVRAFQSKFPAQSIVVSDCGANLCWVYQSYLPDDSFLFTAGGNSPMAYSLPAAIGAQLSNPNKTVFCFIGDGGFQMNIQELQTIVHYKLPIKIIIQNNFGYGIIKQFQDAYFEGRHFATGQGYSLPDFQKIVEGYGIAYLRVQTLQEIEEVNFIEGPMVIDMYLPANSLITPKTEMNRFIHDQFPYINDGSTSDLPFIYPARPSDLKSLDSSQEAV